MARYKQLVRSAIDETIQTTRKIIEEDKPLSAIFTTNETFRNRDAEFLYQRWRVEAGEIHAIPDLSDWPEGGKWAPRFES